MAYYITGAGKYYYGRVAHDYLTALILLAEARKAMPEENWKIVAYKAA